MSKSRLSIKSLQVTPNPPDPSPGAPGFPRLKPRAQQEASRTLVPKAGC